MAFEVEGTPDKAMSCNCSICRRKGSLLWFVPRDKLRLLTPEANRAGDAIRRPRAVSLR